MIEVMRNRMILIGVIVPVLLGACMLKEHPDNIPVQAYRTVLFYLVADGNYAEEVQPRLDALQEAWSNELGLGGHLLVFAGGNPEASPRLMEMVEDGQTGEVSLQVLREYADPHAASAEMLSDVINDMYTVYPSQDYGLVLFSQGSGWLPDEFIDYPRRSAVKGEGSTRSALRGEERSTRSVMSEGNRVLELRNFALAIPDGQFSFIVFETGYMAGLEVAYELKEKADYLIASSTEIPSPGFLPVYGAMLPELFRAYPYYRKAAQAYFDYYNQYTGDLGSATVSVIRTSQLEPLKRMLNAAESGVEDWEELQRSTLQAFDRRTDHHLCYDLGSYFRLIGSGESQSAFADSLDRAVIYRAATAQFLPQSGGFDIAAHSGMTVYIPDAHYPVLNGERRLLRLFQ